MSEMAAQIGQNCEEVQTTPRAETEVSEHNKTPSPKQTEKQKKKEIVADLSADMKKFKPPKFSGFESREEAEAWLMKWSNTLRLEIFLKPQR